MARTAQLRTPAVTRRRLERAASLDRVRDALLERWAPLHERTIGTVVFADRCVAEIADAAISGDLERVRTTAAELAHELPFLPRAPEILSATPGFLRDALAPLLCDEPSQRRVIEARCAAIADEIAPLLAHATATRPPGRDPVSEVDLAIDRLLVKLGELDVLTVEHSRAVSAWCERIAERLDMTSSECTEVKRGGLVHDVGKSAVPAAILCAPRALSALEYRLMQEHVLHGERIVTSDPALRGLTPMVRSHHERHDGTGYPNRLAGHEIPIAVRIVSIADAFNAMIGRRPYRAPLSPDVAIDELRKHRGTQFDPTVVDAMIDCVTHP